MAQITSSGQCRGLYMLLSLPSAYNQNFRLNKEGQQGSLWTLQENAHRRESILPTPLSIGLNIPASNRAL